MAKLLARATPDDDVVFADEAGVNQFAPLLKSPAVGPHTLLSYNVVGRPALVRVETLFAVGGYSPDAGWAYEHDAYLRLSEAKARFRHVPRVLPAGRSERALRCDAPQRGHVQGRAGRSRAPRLARRGQLRGRCRTGQLVARSADAAPSIDIIIPTRDRIELVRQCIESIEEKTTYPNYDIIILDNDSIEPESLAYFDETKYAVVPCPGPFNYAKIVNRGVDHSSADYVVTLNNDTIVVTPDWLEQMISLASLDDVGIVGACLLDRDGRTRARKHRDLAVSPAPAHRLQLPPRRPLLARHARRRRRHGRGADGRARVLAVTRRHGRTARGRDERRRHLSARSDARTATSSTPPRSTYPPRRLVARRPRSARGSQSLHPRWDIFGTFRDPFFPESLLLLGEKMYFFVR